MAALPETRTTVHAIDEAVARNVEAPRGHLGASQIGRPCDRELWYAFRWAQQTEWSGRMLRLFDRGRREEAVFADLLRLAGVRVLMHDPATGRQLSYSDHGGHFAGSLDGLVQGLVEAPSQWMVLECKTHSAKSFADLAKNGVEKSKPEHYAQMQTYMAWSKLDRAYYLAVNKDTDELYGERIKLDRGVAARASARALRIIQSAVPPARLSDDPTWWQCKHCTFAELCHGRDVARASCRTCVHATPELHGSARWSCAHHAIEEIPLHGQREGCSEHRLIPELVSAAVFIDADALTNSIRYRLPSGAEFTNGPPGPDSFTSAELARNGRSVEALLDPAVQAMREAFGACP